jgi:hypothetical protein
MIGNSGIEFRMTALQYPSLSLKQRAWKILEEQGKFLFEQMWLKRTSPS